jgi:hypothetical protein
MQLSVPTVSGRWQGTCAPLTPIDASPLVDWLTAIPFEEWPQECRPADGRIRPAMMQELEWHGFRKITEPTVQTLMAYFPGCIDYNRMLSVVMPGHAIEPHRDDQSEKWVARIHVPLTTNEKALFYSAGVPHNLKVGTAYLVNTTEVHEIKNDGDCPRIHFMFDAVDVR